MISIDSWIFERIDSFTMGSCSVFKVAPDLKKCSFLEYFSFSGFLAAVHGKFIEFSFLMKLGSWTNGTSGILDTTWAVVSWDSCQD